MGSPAVVDGDEAEGGNSTADPEQPKRPAHVKMAVATRSAGEYWDT